jgi:hypothetical protein
MKVKMPAKRVTFSCFADKKPKYPDGYNITLEEIFEQYNVDSEGLDRLREAHSKEGGTLAYAFIGNCSYYRRAQIEKILERK